MERTQTQAIVLAAGKGTRMKSKLPKVLHRLGGRTLLGHVLHTLDEAGIRRRAVIVGHGKEEVQSQFPLEKHWYEQSQQLGTAHAVMTAKEFLTSAEGYVFILCGDAPLIRSQTLLGMLDLAQKQRRGVVLAAEVDDPTGYGRMIRSDEGFLARIVEEKDADPAERAVQEINAGVYCLQPKVLLKALSQVENNNSQGEYYLTDIVEILAKEDQAFAIYTTDDPLESLGVNSRRQLAELEAILRERKLDQLLDSGVTIVDPNSTFVAPTVQVGRDTILLPFTFLEGKTVIGEDCIVGPNTTIQDSTMGRGCHCQYSVILESILEEEVKIGPFAYIRPGTQIGKGAKVGDFVEIKKSKVGAGSKVPHLSYIGDSQIGTGVNIGAGTITCNYDGQRKHQTLIGDGAFIGSNSNLVAPIKIGKDALIGAGSTLTKDVPNGSLAIGRAKQVNLQQKKDH